MPKSAPLSLPSTVYSSVQSGELYRHLVVRRRTLELGRELLMRDPHLINEGAETNADSSIRMRS